jgi:hypothetical protein
MKARHFSELLTQHKPLILHVSCHMTPHDSLGCVLLFAPSVRTGDISSLSGPEFVELLKIHYMAHGGPELVVLHGCQSDTLAWAVYEKSGIPNVIGSCRKLMDSIVVYFAPKLYSHLLLGSTIKTAFEFANIAVQKEYDEQQAKSDQRQQMIQQGLLSAGLGCASSLAPAAGGCPTDELAHCQAASGTTEDPLVPRPEYVLFSRNVNWRASELATTSR